ncbi:P-loop containing nucleoside triphosphate hydrolase protein [Flagelloscypha sp. PMI_526]|nr:P-loop containing nucleoside triphosphate hydrolase protein [Flagelloscypha sp. PMI_526]
MVSREPCRRLQLQRWLHSSHRASFATFSQPVDASHDNVAHASRQNITVRNHIPPPLEDLPGLPFDGEPSFSAPPLLPGFVTTLRQITNVPKPRPTAIQKLSLSNILPPIPFDPASDRDKWSQFLKSRRDAESSLQSYKQYLLGSETGSGKSIAYLLPVLQALKLDELSGSMDVVPEGSPSINPRAIILAPTHELARQLASFAKALLHEVKLRVLCTSRANMPTRVGPRSSEGQPQDGWDRYAQGPSSPAVQEVDIVVSTPMKALEMIRGVGWERSKDNPLRDPNRPDPVEGKMAAKPQMGCSRVKWVVIDEADVLFDPDFQATTRLLLSDVTAQRPSAPIIPFEKDSLLSHDALSLKSRNEKKEDVPNPLASRKYLTNSATTSPTQAIHYPFNLLLASATIPSSLSKYLDATHPSLMRLESHGVHRLPSRLRVKHVSRSGGIGSGSTVREVEQTLRNIWADDAKPALSRGEKPTTMSKVVIFVNKSSRVSELGAKLEEHGIPNVALTSTNEARLRGSNRHLTNFLKPFPGHQHTLPPSFDENVPAFQQTPHVLITTSLLSRGLDFDPDTVKNVFILEEPRNMIDFLHRAGRTARLDHAGTVYLFGKGNKSSSPNSYSNLVRDSPPDNSSSRSPGYNHNSSPTSPSGSKGYRQSFEKSERGQLVGGQRERWSVKRGGPPTDRAERPSSWDRSRTRPEMGNDRSRSSPSSQYGQRTSYGVAKGSRHGPSSSPIRDRAKDIKPFVAYPGKGKGPMKKGLKERIGKLQGRQVRR